MTDPISRTLTFRLSDGANTREKKVTLTSDGEGNATVNIPALSTAKSFNISIDVSALTLLWIEADIDCVVTLGEGNDPIELEAEGEPLVWTNRSHYDCPLSVNVTGGLIETESDVAGTLVIRTQQDATP